MRFYIVILLGILLLTFTAAAATFVVTNTSNSAPG